MILPCKDCGTLNDVIQEGYYNWKCKGCGTINPFNTPTAVIWKCDTGTPKRNN